MNRLSATADSCISVARLLLARLDYEVAACVEPTKTILHRWGHETLDIDDDEAIDGASDVSEKENAWRMHNGGK